MANQFTINPLGGFNLGQALSGLGQQFGRARERDEQMQDMQDTRAFAVQAQSGDPVAMKELFARNPNMAMQLQEVEQNRLSKMDARQKAIADEANFGYAKQLRLAGTPEEKQMILEQVIQDPASDLYDQDDVGKSPEELELDSNILLYSKLGDKGYQTMFGGGYTKEKTLPAESQAFNDLIKDFTPEQQKTAKLIKAGLKGRAITNAELTAIEDGTIDSYSDYKVQQKQAEKFAEATGSQRAKIIDKGFESINKANTALGNIDKAIAVLDKGAGVGAIEKLWPSIKASSVELDNIRGQMALDVVGATTFGALSEGELNLAKDVALPTGLDTAELKDYLLRKKAAQEKLRDYYSAQIQHLDQGGTVASFLREQERGKKQPAKQSAQSEQQNQNNQALQWAQANPNDPRAAQIMQKLQGAQ
jgi:hypothetical protein